MFSVAIRVTRARALGHAAGHKDDVMSAQGASHVAGIAEGRAIRARRRSHAKATSAAIDLRADGRTAITLRNATDAKTHHNRLRVAEEIEAGFNQTTKLHSKACKAHQVVG